MKAGFPAHREPRFAVRVIPIYSELYQASRHQSPGECILSPLNLQCDGIRLQSSDKIIDGAHRQIRDCFSVDGQDPIPFLQSVFRSRRAGDDVADSKYSFDVRGPRMIPV